MRTVLRQALIFLSVFCGIDAEATAGLAHTVPTTQEKFQLATSLVIPCYYEDVKMLRVVLESVSKQTVMPDETILVLSQDTSNLRGATVMQFDFPSADLDGDPQRRDAQFDAQALRGEPAKVIGNVVRANGLPLEFSLLRIPNLKVFVRTGVYWAGHNRMYGVAKSRNETEVFLFFDCDDYMHHRRTEYLAKTFAEHKELDAVIHPYELLDMSAWYFTATYKKFTEDVPYMPGPNPFPYTYEEIRERVPFANFTNAPLGEPKETEDSLWYFPYGMDLPDRGYNVWGANGWVTFRRRVLDKVDYPVERRIGEDSIFNYRILKAGLNWNYLPITLGLYLQDA